MRLKGWFLVLCFGAVAFVILSSMLPDNEPMTCDAFMDTCEWYTGCAEALLPCGDGGYAMWASAWCKEMHSSDVTQFNTLARFVPEFFRCLTKTLEESMQQQPSCAELKTLAVSAYRPCMEEKGVDGNSIGFCDLTLEEWQRILGTVELADMIPHPKELVAALIKECSHCIADQLLHHTVSNKEALARLAWLRTVLDGLPRPVRDEVLAAKIKLPT